MHPDPHHRISTVLAAALAAGVVGDILLRGTPWGINFPLWTAAVVTILLATARRLAAPLPAGYAPVAAATILTGAMLALRDAADLSFWNAAASLAGIGLMASRTRSGSLTRTGVAEAAGNLFLQGIYAWCGSLLLGFSIFKARKEGGGGFLPERWGGILRGAAVAVPALLLFGGLLTAADPGFQYLVEEVLHIDLDTVVSHILLTGFLAWLAAGFLHFRFSTVETLFTGAPPLRRMQAGPTELAMLLGSLDLLFAVFVLVQIPYFFGGHGAVLGNAGLTYAEYARRGFFELITVAAIALPLLLGAEWVLRRDQPRDAMRFRGLALLMLMLLLVMLASAAHRLQLYTSAYGLTPARVHAAAVLVWLAFTLLWFAATVLRGKRERFFYGAVMAAYAFLLLLNAVNPDALVARVNIRRFATTGAFDAPQAARLGAEAVPALLDSINSFPPADRDVLARSFLARYDTQRAGRGWKSWNAALGEAEQAVADRKGELQGMLIPRKSPQARHEEAGGEARSRAAPQGRETTPASASPAATRRCCGYARTG